MNSCKSNLQKGGFLTISLDFELFWGMRDIASIKGYGPNILGARIAIPRLLKVFSIHNISATWATVGFLSFANKKDLKAFIPSELPGYLDNNLDPYSYLSSIGDNENEDPYHYGYSLLRQIQDTPRMEIGSHSFSHFYCLEPRSNESAYLADLESSFAALEHFGVTPKSLVFCRNQYDLRHICDAAKAGFKVYRGNESGFFYKPCAYGDEDLFKRAGRLLDAYFNISGPNHSLPDLNNFGMINLPSSRFLRPWNRFSIEKMRLNRILDGMTEAAQTNSGYHLWWHPHNFGKNLEKNMEFLLQIILHFLVLQDKWGMKSISMGDIGEVI